MALLTVDVPLADVNVLLAEIRGRAVTPEDSEDLSRPEPAVRDCLDEIRRGLTKTNDRW